MSLRSFLLAPVATTAPAAEARVDGHAEAFDRRAASAPASPPVLGLVCERADGAALGAAAALLLLARHRLPSAVVALHRAPPVAGAAAPCEHPGDLPSLCGAHAARIGEQPDAARSPSGAPGAALAEHPGDTSGGPRPGVRAWTLPAARRLASALRARRLPAVATGRLAAVALPDEAADVLAAAERVAVTAVAARAATVVVVAGARAGALDDVLARCDAVVVITPPQRTAVAGLAADALAALGVPVSRATATVRAPARALGAAGLVAPPDLRAALTPALDVVGGRS